MANRFWVGGTGTWNSSSTAFWAATSGAAGGQTVPGTGDVAIFDASSGGGTVTVDSPNGAGVVTVSQITCGAFTGTLDFATNNNDVTLGIAFSGTGSGARTINLGSGTWSLTATSGNPWDITTVTNLTFSGASAAIVISGNASGSRAFAGGGQSYGSLTIQTNSSRGPIQITGANTLGSLSIASGTTVVWPSSVTNTITNGFALTGTSSLPIAFLSGAPSAASTLSLGGTCTIAWGALWRMTKSGAGSLTVSDGLDLGANTSITINPPSGGSSGGQKVYGG